MEKDLSNTKVKQKRLYVLVLGIGIAFTCIMAVQSIKNTYFSDAYKLFRNETGDGAYEQDVVAYVGGMEKIPLKINVEEQILTEQEAEEVFEKAEALLDRVVLDKNKSFDEINSDLYFVDEIPGIPVDVFWTQKNLEYFEENGKIKEDFTILESLELEISAILNCREYSKDYKRRIVLMPRTMSMEQILLKEIESNEEKEYVMLPKEYQGKEIIWKKPMDHTYLYVLILTVMAVVFLKAGNKRDLEIKRKERLEQLEKDYAQIVSKFSMLLSAGLSLGSAWERIVKMDERKAGQERVIEQEMRWALREMQKGVAELEVYENFAERIGEVHYKKLMTIFISHKKRGSVNILEAMNQEMIQAWDEQKRKTRQRGEVIGTKLLVPMMGMLAIIFLMILVPAFLSFQL